MALLEADVALPVVKTFVERALEAALGAEVVGSLTPGQALVGVVHRELTTLMGGEDAALDLAVTPPAVVLLAGLQGSGKTTTAAKLAKLLSTEQRRKPLLVSCDVYRPAAVEQLRTLAAQIGVDFFPSNTGQKPLAIALAALDHARKHYHDVLLVDTAGRLSIDVTMMQEITDLHAALKPVETLFVVDSMQGQDSIKVAKAFGDALPLTGIVLTKLDGAARVLGMGDVLSLVEEARKTVDVEEARKFAEKVKKGKGFDLEDFKQQVGQMRKMGGISSVIDKLPAQFDQGLAQTAYRRRCGCSRAGSESPLESVRADARDDEENAKGGPCEDHARNEGVHAADEVAGGHGPLPSRFDQ